MGGDLWVAGENVGIDEEAQVRRNATVATRTLSVEGVIEKDLYTAAESVELSGVVGEDLEAAADRVRLIGEARVGGNLRFRSNSEDRLHVAESASVDGEVEFLGSPRGLDGRNRYTSVRFYLWQLARLIAAFLVGMAFLSIVPGANSLSFGAGIDALKTAGVGFLAMISVPIMAVLVAFTLIGLPLSIIALVTWLLGIYLAKIVVGAVVGRMLLSRSGSLPLTLLMGLSIVIVAVNLPFIGGAINLVLTIVGLGLLVQYLIGVLPAREAGDLAPP